MFDFTSANRILENKNEELRTDVSSVVFENALLCSDIAQNRKELFLVSEPAFVIGEVIKQMDENQFLVKASMEGRWVVAANPGVQKKLLKAGTRVALNNDSLRIDRVLPTKVDPLVSLMRVERVPDADFTAVGGLEEQIRQISEVVELPLKRPDLFAALGVAPPKGVLLYGPPGTGKTLVARAVAHHTECVFIRVSGGELVQKYIGEGTRLVRELFTMARTHAPSIIFMDEIDSIGGARFDSHGGESEVQRTMLELLNQLDGFEATAQVKVIMATNRLDILDAALLRPGRIDRKIEFPLPVLEGRKSIFQIHSKKMALKEDVDFEELADATEGASGADLKAICTEAGMFALRERRDAICKDDFELALAKVMSKINKYGIDTNKAYA